ncbi:sugar ABC transporter substrate-binding protein [Ralstonia sp. 1138]|uniref:sugar ABC transporter substrate-binding protein n=1 Tax=Ralstonia sp. 1138 TaxID=3156423 RepID=UPI003396B381
MDIRRRRALQLGAGSAVAAALPFPFSLAYAANQPPKVALVMKSLANEFFLTMENGARKHQKDHASEYTLLTNGIRDETDTAGQIRLVEQMLVARVDALVLAPADSKALVPVVKKAVDAGILVINIDNRLDPAALKEKGLNVPFVGPDNRKGARLVGDFVAKSLKPGDAVGIIEGIPTTTNAQQRTAGFKDAAEAAKLKIAGVQSGEWEIDKGNKVAAAMLRSEPNLKALLCGNDNMAIGAVSAVRAAGKLGKVLIGGYDNIDAIKAMLADGRVIATADQHADQQAVYGIETALKALASKTPQAKLSGVVETPVNLVTRS